jgi:hypothetical protein
LANLTAEKTRRLTENRLAYYKPYPKQIEFHAAGATVRERLLMAANQVGKTWAGGSECAMHATGRYPDDWKGYRFNRPTVGWASAARHRLDQPLTREFSLQQNINPGPRLGQQGLRR